MTNCKRIWEIRRISKNRLEIINHFPSPVSHHPLRTLHPSLQISLHLILPPVVPILRAITDDSSQFWFLQNQWMLLSKRRTTILPIIIVYVSALQSRVLFSNFIFCKLKKPRKTWISFFASFKNLLGRMSAQEEF